MEEEEEATKKQKTDSKPKKQTPKKTNDKEKYFHCNVKGHWKRNYPAYLATLKNKKMDMPSEGMSELLVIETNLMIFSSSSWVFDSSSSAHLCTFIQDLEEVRGLREGEITLWVDNGSRVAAVAVGIYPL